MNFFAGLPGLFKKYRGMLYNLIFIAYSWIYGFFLKNVLVTGFTRRIFAPQAGEGDPFLLGAIVFAQLAEIAGMILIVRRMRYIKSHAAEFPGIINPKGVAFEPEGFILLMFAIFVSRIFLSMYIGIMAGLTFSGDNRLYQAAGAFVVLAKDIVLFSVLVKSFDKPVKNRPKPVAGFISATLMTLAGLVNASVGYDNYIERARNVLCTFSHWTGFGNFLLSLIVIFLFVVVLLIPTRIGYYFEEIEFADTAEDYRRLGVSFAVTLVLSAVPWLV